MNAGNRGGNHARIGYRRVFAGCVLGMLSGAVTARAVEPTQTLEGHTDKVRCVAYSPDGNTLASAGFDGLVRLWTMPDGKQRASLKAESSKPASLRIHAIAFSPDGKLLATAGSDGHVQLWDPASARLVRTLEAPKNSVFAVAFSQDGKWVASAGADRLIRLWNAQSGKPAHNGYQGHGAAVQSVAFGADGETIVSGSDDWSVKIFQTDPPELRAVLGMFPPVRAVACSRDDQVLAAGHDWGAITLWTRAARGQPERHILGGHHHGTTALAFSPDGKRLASVGHDGRLRLWDMSARRLLAEATADRTAAFSVAVSPDGKQAATAGADHKVRLWSLDRLAAAPQQPRFASLVEPPRTVQNTHAEETRAVAELKRLGAFFVVKGARPTWSPDATRIAYVSTPTSELRSIELRTGRVFAFGQTARDPAWSPKPGRWIAYTTGQQIARTMGDSPPPSPFSDPPSGDEEIRLIDAAGFEPQVIARGYAPSWSADGKLLSFISGRDQTIKSVEIKADGAPGALVEQFSIKSSSLVAAISPDGRRVAHLRDGRLAVTDRTGDQAKAHWPVRQFRDWLLGWSPDGKLIGGMNIWGFGGLLFLNPDTGQAFRLGTGELVAPAWSPDGSMIAFDVHLIFGSEIWAIDAARLAELTTAPVTAPPKGPTARFDLAASIKPKGKLVCIDIQPKANQTLDLAVFDTPANDLREVPRGEQTFGGARFSIGPGLLQLGGGLLPNAPGRIEGIALGKRAARLYVMHGTQFSGPVHCVADGTVLGWYRVVYDDQTEASITVAAGEDVRSWFSHDPGATTRGELGWEGQNVFGGWMGLTSRLFVSAWTNPHPEKKIARIDYLAAGTQAAPFCVAITAEEPETN